MTEAPEPRITIELHDGTMPTDAAVQRAMIPVSQAEIARRLRSGLTIQELAKLAFDNISADFTDTRIEVGKRLEGLGKGAVLHAYGPDEGVYYFAVPEADNDEA